MRRPGPSLLLVPLLLSPAPAAAGREPSERAREVAAHARSAYGAEVAATLGDLVAFRTVHQEGVENAAHPEFRAMTAYLRRKAEAWGLDFADHGAVVVLGLGEGAERLGVLTHGDVQPADPSKWARDPFRLDTASEPGRLVGRGAVDDKGPLAAALYALKAVRDRGVLLERRIELIVSYTEESDWEPFEAFLAAHPPPRLNVALDSDFPVVVAEKGWGAVHLTLPPEEGGVPGEDPYLASFGGGAFLTQIPEDAEAIIARPSPELRAELEEAAARDGEVRFTFRGEEGKLAVRARGRAAHSSTPEEGRNALTHLAALLGSRPWPRSRAAQMVELVNDLVGTGHYGERFGDLAYAHPFMGPLTLSLTTLEEAPDGALVAGVNLRMPAGRSTEEIEEEIRRTVAEWSRERGVPELAVEIELDGAHYEGDAPHVPVLLEIFRFYTGMEDAEPVAIGGGTHARLVPEGVNFGPALPGEPYTGHSEHEFLAREHLLLCLEMYAAMLVELAGR